MMSFVSETDISESKKHNINYEADIIVFINEMKQYFYNTSIYLVPCTRVHVVPSKSII